VRPEFFLPVVAIVSTVSLGLVALMSSQEKDLGWRTFATFCFLLTGPPLVVLGVRVVPQGAAIYVLRLAPPFVIAALTAALVYVAVVGELYIAGTRFGRRYELDFHDRPGGRCPPGSKVPKHVRMRGITPRPLVE
jgi:hypothetical protein